MKRLAGFGLLLIAVVAIIYLVSAQTSGRVDSAQLDAQTSTVQASQESSEETAEEAEQETTEEASDETTEETARTDAGAAEENPVVIRLGEQEVRLDEFDERFEIAMLGVAAQQGVELNDELRAQLGVYKPQFLDQRATELALLEEAKARELSVSDEDLEAQVEEIRSGATEEQSFEDIYTAAGFESEEDLRAYLSEQLLVEQLVGQLQEEATVSEEDVSSAYEARAEEFAQGEQVCARHILLESEEDANAALEELEGGADFAQLAQERSTGPSGPDGGDLGCFTQDRMVAPFGKAAFAAEIDTPVGPVQTEFGYHVILVYDRQEAGQIPLEQVAPQLEQELSQEAFLASIDAVRESSGIEAFPDVLEPAQLPAESTEDASAGEGDTESSEETEEDSEDSE